MVLPAFTPAGYVFPPASSSQKLNPNFGRVTGMLWQANAFYNTLQMVITKKVSHGLQVRGAYTRGKSIDTLSATVADDAYPNGLLNPYSSTSVQPGACRTSMCARPLFPTLRGMVPAPKIRAHG